MWRSFRVCGKEFSECMVMKKACSLAWGAGDVVSLGSW